MRNACRFPGFGQRVFADSLKREVDVEQSLSQDECKPGKDNDHFPEMLKIAPFQKNHRRILTNFFFPILIIWLFSSSISDSFIGWPSISIAPSFISLFASDLLGARLFSTRKS